MEEIYAVFEGTNIIRMSENRRELLDYMSSFPQDQRREMCIAKRITTLQGDVWKVWKYGSRAGEIDLIFESNREILRDRIRDALEYWNQDESLLYNEGVEAILRIFEEFLEKLQEEIYEYTE